MFVVERLKVEQELRVKAEAAAAEAERARTVMAADYKDVSQKFERVKEELRALQEKVQHSCHNVSILQSCSWVFYILLRLGV